MPTRPQPEAKLADKTTEEEDISVILNKAVKLNEAVKLIYTLDLAFRRKENGTSCILSDLSHQVIPLGVSYLRDNLFVFCRVSSIRHRFSLQHALSRHPKP